MIHRLQRKGLRLLLAVLWLTLPVIAAGAEPVVDPWQAFVRELAHAGDVIHRKETPKDPITQAEGFRYLSRLIRRGLETGLEFGDSAHPHLFRANTRSMLTGGTTADAIYVHGFIDGSRTYKIRGDRGTAPLMEFTVYSGMLGLHPSKRKVRQQQVRKIDYITHRFRSFEQKIGTKSETLLTANEDRRYLLIQNKGTGTAQISFGAAALDGGVNSIDLAPNTSISFENGICPNNDVFAICLPTTIVTVIEGLRD